MFIAKSHTSINIHPVRITPSSSFLIEENELMIAWDFFHKAQQYHGNRLFLKIYSLSSDITSYSASGARHCQQFLCIKAQQISCSKQYKSNTVFCKMCQKKESILLTYRYFFRKNQTSRNWSFHLTMIFSFHRGHDKSQIGTNFHKISDRWYLFLKRKSDIDFQNWNL
jgi:hypothetical protein